MKTDLGIIKNMLSPAPEKKKQYICIYTYIGMFSLTLTLSLSVFLSHMHTTFLLQIFFKFYFKKTKKCSLCPVRGTAVVTH